MATVTFEATLSFPLGAEADPPERTLSVSLVYTKRTILDLEVTGEAEGGVSLMGALDDAKMALVELVSGDGFLTANGGERIDLAATGGLWFWNSPDGGLTALFAEATESMRLRVYLFS